MGRENDGERGPQHKELTGGGAHCNVHRGDNTVLKPSPAGYPRGRVNRRWRTRCDKRDTNCNVE